MVLLALVRLKGEAYGVPITDEIERCTGRTVSPAAVYVTLRRLEQKRLVSSRMGGPLPERGASLAGWCGSNRPGWRRCAIRDR